jgi:hypothetical protein
MRTTSRILHASGIRDVVGSDGGSPVSCARDPSAEAGDGVEDFFGGLGPDELLGVFVPVFDPGPDVGFQANACRLRWL